MATQDDPDRSPGRIEQLEIELAATQRRLREAEGGKSRPSRFQAALDVVDKLVAPILIPAAIAAVGWMLTGSFDQLIQQQQLELAQGKELQELLFQMASGNPNEAQTAATALAAYGKAAVVPLVRGLHAPGESAQEAARTGLRAFALGGKEQVDHACEILGRVAGNRTRLYKWAVHLEAIRLLGSLGCRSQTRELESLDKLLREDAQKAAEPFETQYRNFVADSQDMEPRDFDDLCNALEESLCNLRQLAGESCRRLEAGCG